MIIYLLNWQFIWNSQVQDLFVHDTKIGALMPWIWFSWLTSLELQIWRYSTPTQADSYNYKMEQLLQLFYENYVTQQWLNFH